MVHRGEKYKLFYIHMYIYNLAFKGTCNFLKIKPAYNRYNWDTIGTVLLTQVFVNTGYIVILTVKVGHCDLYLLKAP